MKMEMSGQLRMEQKMKLAPRMIQSMEILQLPIIALQERIEQELNGNPVLEIDEPSNVDQTASQSQTSSSNETDSGNTEDFDGIENLDEGYRDNKFQSESFQKVSRNDEVDKKLEAIKNTVAPGKSLHEHLTDQWRLVEVGEKIKNAGQAIIDYIDDRGYLTVRLEQLYNKDKTDFGFDDLKEALIGVQKLEPTGVGARDLAECLLIQMDQSDEDMGFARRIVLNHMKELLENRLPDIAKKMHCNLEQVNKAIESMSKLDTSPGLQIGQSKNLPISADIIIEKDSDSGEYIVWLADSSLPSLRINEYYSNMSKESEINKKTKEFLQNNIRSAQWIIEAIEQRKNTLLRVARTVVKYQVEFFDKGQLYLKPLPMARVAEDVGVHLATVSRAVAGKYVQCNWGLLPLRKFFSGGVEDDNGVSHSWEAIRAKLQTIIDQEDKAKPLSDDKIRDKLAEMGINDLARRTVAKYRKLMKIPTAKFRKKY